MATRSILLRKANTSSFLRHQQLRWKNGRWFRPNNLSPLSQRLVSTAATTSNNTNFNHNLRPTRQQQQQSSNNKNDLNLWAAVTATVGISAYALQKDAQPSKCDVAAATADNRRKTTERRQPHNVMLHRKRSIRGRNLNEKYNVDWSKCLGEGAYGSVHPARLAATGEKVRKRTTRWPIFPRIHGHSASVTDRGWFYRLFKSVYFEYSSPSKPVLTPFHSRFQSTGCPQEDFEALHIHF